MAPITVKEGDNREQDIAKFELLLAEGKQAYITNKLKDAEVKLSEAAGLSVNIYGYFAVESFEPHFYYGKTLLELARMEDEVFWNALQGMIESGDGGDDGGDGGEGADKGGDDDEKSETVDNTEHLTEKERAEIAEKVVEALKENAEALEKKGSNGHVDSRKGVDVSCKGGEEKEKAESDAENKAEAHEAMETGKDDAKNKQADDGDETSTDVKVGGGEKNNDNGEEKTGEKNEVDGEEKAEEKGDKDEDMEKDESKKVEEEGEESKDETLNEDEGKNDETGNEKEVAEESGDAGDVEYLQLAWENLEVARTICDKHLEDGEEGGGWKEKKVEVLLELVDCASDSENYKQAIDDIDACITLMESIFHEDDRRIAQAYYVKARTLDLSKDFENAAKMFEKSKAVLEAKLAKLETDLAIGNETEEAANISEEIDELKLLVPEIQIKIDDCLESAKSLAEKAESTAKSEVMADSTMKEMPVDDVSNLVRKKAKRPAEDTLHGDEAKRTKGDDEDEMENASVDSTT